MQTLTPHKLKNSALLAITEINERAGVEKIIDSRDLRRGLMLRRVDKSDAVIIARKKLGPWPLREGEEETFAKFGLKFVGQQYDKKDSTLRLLRFEPIKHG